MRAAPANQKLQQTARGAEKGALPTLFSLFKVVSPRLCRRGGFCSPLAWLWNAIARSLPDIKCCPTLLTG